MTRNSSATLVAVVPMKPVRGGKSRLSGVLDSESRAALSLFLLQKVLRTLNKSKTATQTRVIGGDEPVRAVVKEESACWLEDPGTGLNGAVSYAVNKAFAEGAPAVLILPGDLALIQPEDIDSLAEMSFGYTKVVLSRAESDGGTNAILAPAGKMVGPCFGTDSFKKHLEAAISSNFPVAVASLPHLAFDMDTPKDLESYRRKCPNLDDSISQIKTKYLSRNTSERDPK